MLVTTVTMMADAGEINMAMKIGTWLAKVNDIGGIQIFGINIGMMIPSAHKSAEMHIETTASFFFMAGSSS
ncbi:hypothetical protein B5F35_04700 [Anaeromassilibacillus sp. An200]|nr:hypothetical protein B5F35_04700 [Anaeromassilibacillus sp. An200]